MARIPFHDVRIVGHRIEAMSWRSLAWNVAYQNVHRGNETTRILDWVFEQAIRDSEIVEVQLLLTHDTVVAPNVIGHDYIITVADLDKIEPLLKPRVLAHVKMPWRLERRNTPIF